jgi:hypothetical protein
LEDQIVEAIARFDYPPVTYDFIAGCELSFPSMIDLDHYLQDLLLSGAQDKLKTACPESSIGVTTEPHIGITA